MWPHRKEPMTTKQTSDPLKPEIAVMVALGSLAVHIEELLATPSCLQGKTLADQIEGLTASAGFDLAAIRGCLDQDAVRIWLAEMDKLALLPRKR